ncbi:hypothetical protein VOLCADRAFT_99041 [Volvox carteri f. nagariensis]|uniref:Uncharacterized protein n=1 Tax=Volvox carteri f. nagariensis TaxID=3068 RepID=D8UGW7_VOLCA|nr:uncharacterized protein VOLCADRAFT_99041 [Volvox carteri f. nagariensis]EFJ41025.1 hypothetical protein VOLCADRAFT_99041 [Volvox carteri f. nagariensis]|eukprot:XP_002957889.1 hypothetical protein VOLCADRAFT_99041 [Volvox carteri f. nagariensis]
MDASRLETAKHSWCEGCNWDRMFDIELEVLLHFVKKTCYNGSDLATHSQIPSVIPSVIHVPYCYFIPLCSLLVAIQKVQGHCEKDPTPNSSAEYRHTISTTNYIYSRSRHSERSAANVLAVSLYQSESKGVIDLSWDNGSQNLEAQLKDLGLDVHIAVDGQPAGLESEDAMDAYIIPAQNGQVLYSNAEDMEQVAAFVSSGGLVIILDAGFGEGATTRDFVSKALKYQGEWQTCQHMAGRSEPLTRPTLSRWASSFLPDIRGSIPWPRELEVSPATGLSTWCHHEDVHAVTVPLYRVIGGDATWLAAQAFGKVGSPGAVVWLGYSWKDGPQPQWGALLKKLITDFANGARGSAFSGHPVNPVTSGKYGLKPQATKDIEEVQETVFHRALAAAAGTYPPPEALHHHRPRSRFDHHPKTKAMMTAVARF